MKRFRKILRSSSVAAEPDGKKLWRQIESRIMIDNLYSELNRSILEKAIEDLPAINPEKDIWENIILNIESPKYPNRYLPKKYFIRIAASIVLIVASFILLNRFYPKTDHLKTIKQQPVESFLNYICATYPEKCRETDFLELKSEIIRLNNEKSEVENSIFFNPADESISRLNERINNQMTDLKSQIIKYVE